MGKEDVMYTYVHTMEYYSTIKKNLEVSFKITWMDLEGVMLSKINQTGKKTTLCYHLYVGSEK